MWDRVIGSPRRDNLLYIDQLLKHVVSRCERTGTEVDEDLLELLGDCHEKLAVLNNAALDAKEVNEDPEPDIVVERWYLLHLCATPIRILEDQTGILTRLGTTGLRTWEACLRFVEFLCSGSNVLDSLKGENTLVIELGAGCGLLGLAVASLVPGATIRITDGDAHVLSRLRKNLALNSFDSGTDVAIAELDWSSPRPFIASLGSQTFKKVALLAADVTYDPASLPFLVSALAALLALAKDAKGYLAATIRNSETWRVFLGLLAEHGLCWKAVDGWDPEGTKEGQMFWHADEPDRRQGTRAKVELVEISKRDERAE
jgi:hypothetical protein